VNIKMLLTNDHVTAIRAMKLANPKMSAKTIRDTLGLKCGYTKVYYIMYNLEQYDPTYDPIPTSTARRTVNYNAERQARKQLQQFRKSQVEKPPQHVIREIKPKRKPSIECACLCPTCGFGYDRMDEALKCCERMKEA